MEVFFRLITSRACRGLDWVSFSMLQGTKQDSNVSTLGDVAVAGRGDSLGLRAIFNLPPGQDFSQSATLGIDYKHFDQMVDLGTSGSGSVESPITYYPISASYSADWTGKRSSSDLNLGLTFNLREAGGNQAEFANTRFNSDGGFVYLHGDLSHTRELPFGFQVFGKVQGQLSDQPLISGEEASGGGLGTVRGYLEAEVVGDNAAFGSVELRSPSLLSHLNGKPGELRLFGFYDVGVVSLTPILFLGPKHRGFTLRASASEPGCTSWTISDGLVSTSASPSSARPSTKAGDVRVTFRAELDY